ncbi:MAG: hypothetical protein AAGE52_31150 [Myxococcota bacterium]
MYVLIVRAFLTTFIVAILVALLVATRSLDPRIVSSIVLHGGAFVFLLVITARRAKTLKARKEATNQWQPVRGTVLSVLDGALVAAAESRSEWPFVARFLVETDDGVALVDGGYGELVGLIDVHVGDTVDLQGPHEMEAIAEAKGESYRGGASGRVFRGTTECPLRIARP